ncbi:MAG: hypothetical protein AAGN15_19750 [Cyanobacteria bacterium J06581_3]
MSDAETTQHFDAIDERLNQLTGAVDTLVTQFLHPLAQQSLENQRSIARLIERSEQHQEWLDEDRHDIAEWRQVQAERSQQIQSLIDSARADRIKANERFEQQDQRFEEVQTEIRQNQRLLLSGQERLDSTLDEILSLSRRVQAVEDTP